MSSIPGSLLPGLCVESSLHSFCMSHAGTPSNAGQVRIQSSAKPLVPYPVGISVQPQTHEARRSRFAEESDAAGRPVMTPHPIRHVQNSPQVSFVAGSLTDPTPACDSYLAPAVSLTVTVSTTVTVAVAMLCALEYAMVSYAW